MKKRKDPVNQGIIKFPEHFAQIIQALRPTGRETAYIKVTEKGLDYKRTLEILVNGTRKKPGLQKKSALKNKTDFAIISFREDEYSAVMNYFAHEEFLRGKRRTYSATRLKISATQTLLIAKARTSRQGAVAAQKLTAAMIEDLNPKWIVVVGIAGAIPETEFTLGDVLVALRLHDLTVGAAIYGKDREIINNSRPVHSKVEDLCTQLPAMQDMLKGWNTEENIGMSSPSVELTPNKFIGDSKWKQKAREALTYHFGNGAQIRPPLATARSIASSNTLIKDPDTAQSMIKLSRDIVGFEMELDGVLEAAGNEYPVLAIRGISDIVGFKRNPDWTRYAGLSASAFASALIPQIPRFFRRKF